MESQLISPKKEKLKKLIESPEFSALKVHSFHQWFSLLMNLLMRRRFRREKWEGQIITDKRITNSLIRVVCFLDEHKLKESSLSEIVDFFLSAEHLNPPLSDFLLCLFASHTLEIKSIAKIRDLGLTQKKINQIKR